MSVVGAPAAGTTRSELAELMVGREVLFTSRRTPQPPGEVVFAVEGLRYADGRGRVRLNDINGNLIDFPDTVYFRIMNTTPPAGANLNNQPASDSVMVVSTGGEAQVSVNSGTESGILIIRASLTNKAGRWVHATKANIVIHAGPPAFVLPFIGGFNTGQNMGGGLWQIVAGAEVKDVYGNAVQNNTAVFFSLVNPGETDCQIIGSAFVGNVSVEDDSLAGVAYTTLTYSGIYTNDVITIKASTGEGMGQGVDGYATVALPLNDPRLDVQANPAMLVYGNNSPDWKSTDIFAVLTDGQGQLIGNSALMLLCTKGQFVAIPGYNNNYPTDPAWRIITDDGSYGTGDYRGWAWGQIRFHRLEIPIGDPNMEVPGQTLATICLLYTSDAADDLLCVDLGGRRIIKKKKKTITTWTIPKLKLR